MDKKIIGFFCLLSILQACSVDNGYSVSTIDTNLYFSVGQSDSSIQLILCPRQLENDSIDFYLGLTFNLDFEIFHNNIPFMPVPEPGLDGILYPIESISAYAHFEKDTIQIDTLLAFDHDFSSYQLFNCDQNSLFRPIEKNRRKSINTEIYTVSENREKISFEEIKSQINETATESREEYFLKWDFKSSKRRVDSLKEISTIMTFANGKVLTSRYSLWE